MRLSRIVKSTGRKLRRLYLTLRYRRIWPKLSLVLLLAVNIPVIFTCFFLIHTGSSAIRGAVYENHAQIAYRVAQEISEYVRMPQDILKETAASFSAINAQPWEQETILINHVLNYPFFIRICSLAPDGSVLAGSDLDSSYVPDDRSDISRSLVEGVAHISRIKDDKSHFPYLTVSVPMFEKGKVAGALVGDINLRSLWRVMDAVRLDKTGTVFVVSNEGVLIAAQDKKRVLRSVNLRSDPDVRAALSNRRGSVGFSVEGKQWVGSYAPVPGLGWAVVLRQERSEALFFSKRMKEQSLALLFFIELFAVIISVILARILARPLKAIAASMREVSNGNLDHKLSRRRYDEIGTLFKAFNIMIEKLKKAKQMERFSSIGEASACITHEFKNSMVALKSFVQLFPSRHNDEDFVETFSALVPEEMKRWERMLKELSEFSAVDEVEKQPVRLTPCIADVLKMMEQECRNRNISVSFSSKEDEPVMADGERIKQVVMNIVLNSVQAMPEGGELAIVKDIHKKDASFAIPFVRIRITDTGKGISADMLSRIFEPFHSSKSGSLGLGLAISRRIVENHGGTISVVSQKNVGTSFTICLPKTETA